MPISKEPPIKIADRLNGIERHLDSRFAQIDGRFARMDQKFMWLIGISVTSLATIMLAVLPY